MSMITDRIRQHEVLLLINHKHNKIWDILGSFLIKTQEILRVFFLLAMKKNHSSMCDGRHDVYCSITLSC